LEELTPMDLNHQPMKKILFLLFVFSFQFTQAQQNTIIIIADDLGSDYLGYYFNVGDTAPTPSIRSLLAQGVQFNNAWANPVCSPTRAALFTGRYGFRTGVGEVITNASTPQLDTAERSVARLLRDFAPVKYETANVGNGICIFQLQFHNAYFQTTWATICIQGILMAPLVIILIGHE
jgi:hypothetical protein